MTRREMRRGRDGTMSPNNRGQRPQYACSHECGNKVEVSYRIRLEGNGDDYLHVGRAGMVSMLIWTVSAVQRLDPYAKSIWVYAWQDTITFRALLGLFHQIGVSLFVSSGKGMAADTTYLSFYQELPKTENEILEYFVAPLKLTEVVG